MTITAIQQQQQQKLIIKHLKRKPYKSVASMNEIGAAYLSFLRYIYSKMTLV